MTDEDLARLVGERVRRFREERGMSQQALADRTGIQRPNISRLERAKRSRDGVTNVPHLKTLHYVAQGLGVQVWELLWVPSDHALEPAE